MDKNLDELESLMKLMKRVCEAAEVLSAAMVEAEDQHDADFEMVDEPWQHLTAALIDWNKANG